MSGFPSWKPQAGAAPLPFLSLSLKHVPSKSPSLQTPPVEPSPDLLPKRPTFLRLATVKRPAQARTQIPLSHLPPVHIQTTRNTQRRGWIQRPPVHTGGSTWSSSDPGLTDKYKQGHVLVLLQSAHHRHRSTVSSVWCSQICTNMVTHRAWPCRETSANLHHTVSVRSFSPLRAVAATGTHCLCCLFPCMHSQADAATRGEAVHCHR